MSTGLGSYQIFGIDLVVYVGAVALILFIFVALIKSLNKHILEKRGKEIYYYWHRRIAIFAIFLVIIHVALQYI